MFSIRALRRGRGPAANAANLLSLGVRGLVENKPHFYDVSGSGAEGDGVVLRVTPETKLAMAFLGVPGAKFFTKNGPREKRK